MRTIATMGFVMCIALLFCITLPFPVHAASGEIRRVSIASDGVEGNGESRGPCTNTDGRYIIFNSYSDNLVPGDTNSREDVFLHDRATGTTERVSITSDAEGNPVEGNNYSTGCSVSSDARYVAFSSAADNLVPGDENGKSDVFVRDRASGTTERVSVSSAGVESDGTSSGASMSSDGRFVAFLSEATTLDPADTNGFRDCFVHDRKTGTTEVVSLGEDGIQGNQDVSSRCRISGDGVYAGFTSGAGNLVPGDTNGAKDVFVRHIEQGTTERVSVSTDQTQGNFDSPFLDDISSDGRFVVFASHASMLTKGDDNGHQDVFLRDRERGITELVSVGTGQESANAASFFGSVSDDGRFVVFGSRATNLDAGDTYEYVADVFLRDRKAGTTNRIVNNLAGTSPAGENWGQTVSDDGSLVAFSSVAGDIIRDDRNDQWDVLVYDNGGRGKGASKSPDTTATASRAEGSEDPPVQMR